MHRCPHRYRLSLHTMMSAKKTSSVSHGNLCLPSRVPLTMVSTLIIQLTVRLLIAIATLLTFSVVVRTFVAAGALAHVAEQDEDDGDAMQAVAEMRERRQRRHQQQHERRRPASQLSSTSTARVHRPLESVTTIGAGDYHTADVGEERQEPEGGEYSAEKLAALRLNAIHIGPTHTPSPPPTHIETVLDDDSSSSLTERERRMVRTAKAQRARQRAITDLGEDFIPIASTTALYPRLSAEDDDVIRIDVDGMDERERVPDVRVNRTYLTAEDEDESGHGTLMREEDEDDVVDMTMEAREVKEQDRLLFGDDGKQKRKEKARQEIKDTLKSSTERDEVEVEDVDSEMEEWEAEQLRKGGVRVAERKTAPPQRFSSKARSNERDTSPSSPQISLASLSLSSLQSSLQSSLSTLHHTNTAAQSSLASLANRLTSSRSTLATLTSSLDRLNERYQFYQQERDWVTVWSGMMAEKIADIDEAWQEMTTMRRKHGEERQARMRQYRRDEREETGLLGKVVGEDGGVAELDEFGRDMGYVREMDRERRDNIRSAAKTLLHQKPQRPALSDWSRTWLVPSGSETLDGWASEDEVYDEVEGVTAVQEAARVSFVDDVRGIMADVEDEWRSADRVVKHLWHWQQKDKQSYHDAYVNLTLFKMFAPYVRIDLMLNNTWRTKDSSKWPDLGSTVELLPQQLYQSGWLSAVVQLVAELVVPWLCEVLKWEWEVRSAWQGHWLHEMLTKIHSRRTSLDEEHITDRYDRQLQQLWDVVIERRRVEITEWQPLTALDGDKVSELQLRAIVRECARGAKLLHLMTTWYSLSDLPWSSSMRSNAIARLKELIGTQRSHLVGDLLVLSQQLSLFGEPCAVAVEDIKQEIAAMNGSLLNRIKVSRLVTILSKITQSLLLHGDYGKSVDVVVDYSHPAEMAEYGSKWVDNRTGNSEDVLTQ